MESLFNAVENWNHQYWCLFKHALWAYQYATECLYANLWNPWIWNEICVKSYTNLIAIANKFLWWDWIETCWRCLADKFESNKKAQE
jgi:hypothetical protein